MKTQASRSTSRSARMPPASWDAPHDVRDVPVDVLELPAHELADLGVVARLRERLEPEMGELAATVLRGQVRLPIAISHRRRIGLLARRRCSHSSRVSRQASSRHAM